MRPPRIHLGRAAALLGFALLLAPSWAWALTRTISNAGGNYNTTGAWAEASIPTSADAVVATATSGQLTITAAAAALTVDLTGYTNTLTINNGQTWTISGTTFKLASGMALAGTGTVAIGTAGCTLTSVAKSVPWNLTLTGSLTHVLADDWTVTGLTTLGTGANALVLNWTSSQTLNANGGLTAGVSTGTVSGTAKLKIGAAGTVTGPSSTGTLKNSLEFAAGAGTIVIPGSFRYNTGVLTYTSGTMSLTSTPVLYMALATTLDTSGMTWADITVPAAVTITLTSDLNWSGTLWESLAAATWTGAGHLGTGNNWTINGSTSGTTTINAAVTISGVLTLGNTTGTTFAGAYAIQAASCTISGGQTITLVHDVTITGNTVWGSDGLANILSGAFNWSTGGMTVTGALTGTSSPTIILTGGTWQGAAACSVSVTIAGSVALSGTLYFAASGTPTLTWQSGTVTQGTSVLSIASSCTLTTAGMTWHNVTLTAALTLTLGSALTADGELQGPNAAVTFAGSGFTVATFDNAAIASSAKSYQFNQSSTYTVTSALNISGASAALTLTLVSSHGTLYVPIVLNVGAAQDVAWVVATRVNSSGGQQIFDYKGNVAAATNWTTAAGCGFTGIVGD